VGSDGFTDSFTIECTTGCVLLRLKRARNQRAACLPADNLQHMTSPFVTPTCVGEYAHNHPIVDCLLKVGKYLIRIDDQENYDSTEGFMSCASLTQVGAKVKNQGKPHQSKEKTHTQLQLEINNADAKQFKRTWAYVFCGVDVRLLRYVHCYCPLHPKNDDCFSIFL